MSCNIYYVYQYLNKDNIPYYIGKGSKNRINESHSPWIELPPTAQRIIVQNNMSEKAAFDLEIYLIKQFGRKIDGGILDNKKISRWVSQAGWRHSDETKKQISNKNTGKVRSEQHKENYRKSKTTEHAEKIKKAVKQLWDNPEYREQRLAMIREKSFAHKGKPWSPARREAQMKKQNNKGITI